MIDLERAAERSSTSNNDADSDGRNPTPNGDNNTKKKTKLQSQLLAEGDFMAMRRSVRRYPYYVNQFFMKRAKEFMDGYARSVLNIEYYWGRVEFAAGRGQIHLHILGIAKNKAYLTEFYRAKSEEEKVAVLERYARSHLDMTADVQYDADRTKFDPAESGDVTSPLASRFSDAQCLETDARNLAQDSMDHVCNTYCLGPVSPGGMTCRKCRFNYGQESTPNKGDTPGRDLQERSSIVRDSKGVEHFFMPRLHSRTVVQHSRSLLQAWRANADVQLMIYRSNPDCPDVSEIENVCRYVVAYAGKRYKTTKQEKDMIQNIILR